MGNSQSVSVNKVVRFVRKCIKFYDAVKKEQQQQYPGHVAPSNHHQQQHDNHYDISYHQVQQDHDDPEYTRLRALAHEEAEKRNRCYAESQAAYHGGDGARGNIRKYGPVSSV